MRMGLDSMRQWEATEAEIGARRRQNDASLAFSSSKMAQGRFRLVGAVHDDRCACFSCHDSGIELRLSLLCHDGWHELSSPRTSFRKPISLG